MVLQGKVSAVLDSGKKVNITPAGGSVSAPLTVPFFLIGATPVGTAVAYSIFDDGTGIILARMDGEWNHSLQAVEEG